MTATEGYNSVDEPTSLVYKKETHCTESCEWFKDSVVPSIHGQWLSQASTFGTWSYTYDEIGRLTQVQQTPVGKGCVTRDYGYEEETNRTSLSIYEPNSKGECASETGVVQRHSYDSADRLTDPGTSYEAFGNITSLPAADAGGSELSSTFYVDNQLASQEQAGQRIGYNLDPTGRINETISTGKIVNTVTNHYAGPSTEPAWTSEISGQYKRNIPGINGELAAIQTNEETPILQVVNLQGDIVATASKSETASGLASTIAEPSEYGVPATETPPKYSWLGAHQLPTELPSGIVEMGARSYVPEVGRFLQTDPVPGGSANPYAYTYGDPINSTDLSGELTENRPTSGLAELSAQTSAEAAAEQAAINAAARAEAERKAAEAAAMAARWAAMEDGMAEEYEEEWWEEEEEYEYAAYDQGAKPARDEAHIEGGLLYQTLGAGQNANDSLTGSVISLCKADVDGPCADEAMRFQRALCTGAALFAALCGNGDEKYRVTREDPPVQRSSFGKEAEKAADKSDGDGGGVEEDLEIACEILCPD